MNQIEQELAKSLAIAAKDVARATAFLPAVMKRATELFLSAGVGSGDPAAAVQFAKETRAIAQDYADERAWFGDPFKDEREHMRIYAKRNGLDERFQALIGVSDGTPVDYPAAFRAKYLK